MTNKNPKHWCLFDIYGEWEKLGDKSGLVERVRLAWKKPFGELTNKELATLIRQKFAIEYIMPLARQRILEDNDESESYDGELEETINQFDVQDNV